MNGSSYNTHTVSPRQVARLEETIDGILSKTKNEVENETNNFFKRIAKNWEDDNAILFARKIQNEMRICIADLATGGNKLKEQICDIHNRYARAGGRNTVLSPTSLNFNPALDISCVKDTFDGDRYGFEDSKSVGMVLKDFGNLVKKCNSYGEEMSSNLSGINAFGNTQIITTIAKASKTIFDNFQLHLKNTMKICEVTIEDVIKKYEVVSTPEAIESLSAYSQDLSNAGSPKYARTSASVDVGLGVNPHVSGTGLDVIDGNAVAGRFGGSNIAADLHAGGSNYAHEVPSSTSNNVAPESTIGITSNPSYSGLGESNNSNPYTSDYTNITNTTTTSVATPAPTPTINTKPYNAVNKTLIAQGSSSRGADFNKLMSNYNVRNK